MKKIRQYLLAANEAHYTIKLLEDVAIVSNGKHRIEVRGKGNYAIDHTPNDPLHKFLDKLDPATVSKLFDGTDPVFLNPKNPRTIKSIEVCRELFDE